MTIVRPDLTCGACQVRDGELHRPGCTLEACPFCHSTSIQNCNCAYEQLGLLNPKHPAKHNHLPKIVFEEGLDPIQQGKWEDILEAKGRIPHRYPISRHPWSGKGESPRQILIALFEAIYRAPEQNPRWPAGSPVTGFLPAVHVRGFGKFTFAREVLTGPKPGKPIFSIRGFNADPELQSAADAGTAAKPPKFSIATPTGSEVDATNLVQALEPVFRSLAERKRAELPEVAEFYVVTRGFPKPSQLVSCLCLHDFKDALTERLGGLPDPFKHLKLTPSPVTKPTPAPKSTAKASSGKPSAPKATPKKPAKTAAKPPPKKPLKTAAKKTTKPAKKTRR